MILTPYELPSNGLDSNSETINVPGLGFQDMLQYSEEYEAAKTPFKKFLVDYNWIKKVVPNWKTINLVDLDAVILRWKIESISENSEFTVNKRCPECGEMNYLSLTLQQLDAFKPIQYELEGEVILGGQTYKYKCPSLEFFDNVVIKTGKSTRIKNLEILKLIATFPDFDTRPNQIENAVINARVKDIQVLKTLIAVFYDSEITVRTRCPKCKNGDWSMGVNTLIDSPFQCLVLTSGSISDKITIKPVGGLV